MNEPSHVDPGPTPPDFTMTCRNGVWSLHRRVGPSKALFRSRDAVRALARMRELVAAEFDRTGRTVTMLRVDPDGRETSESWIPTSSLEGGGD